MTKIITILVLLFTSLIGCENNQSEVLQTNSLNTVISPTPTPKSQSFTPNYKLPSGKQIKVNAEGKMHFDNGEVALVLNYETEIPIENMKFLREEVDEVWSIFQKDVEKAELNTAIIRASHLQGNDTYRSGKSYGFVYYKHDDGKWVLLDDEKEKK